MERLPGSLRRSSRWTWQVLTTAGYKIDVESAEDGQNLDVEPDILLDKQEQGLAPDSETLPGAVINEQYRVESVIASGGWGSVVKAWHLQLERYCALKLLHPHLAWDASKVARFKQEAQAASMLSHQNILSVKDYGYWFGRPYLVMDFLSGHTLADEIKAAPNGMTADRFLEIFQQVTKGVATAHRAEIVHRDLTPNNIFIVDEGPEKGCVKVLDFGLAKFVSPDGESGASLTQTGASLGTPAYMSPEQCKGERVDFTTDLYSLGCCMYEALSGKKPFVHDTVFGYMSSHVDKQPSPIAFDTPLLADLETISLWCLEKDREQRPKSGQEVADLLDALRAGNPIQIASKRKKRKRISRAVIVVAAMMALIFAGSLISVSYFALNRQLFTPAWQKEAAIAGEEFRGNNYQTSAFHSKKAIELAAKDTLTHVQMGELYYNLAAAAFSDRDWNTARSAFDSARDQFEEDGHQKLYLASVYAYLMKIEFETGHPKKAVEWAEMRVELLRQLGRPAPLSDALGNLADSYARVGDVKKMRVAMEEALTVDRGLKDDGRVFHRYVNYGDMLDHLHRHYLAAAQYRQALAIMSDEPTEKKLQAALEEGKKHQDPPDAP